MNRRDFLRVLAGATTAAGLLVPSTTKIFLPPRGGWPMRQLSVEISFDLSTGLYHSHRLNPASGITQDDIDWMLAYIGETKPGSPLGQLARVATFK